MDPSFDFQKESRALAANRQRAQMYAHEILKYPPYDGMLISRAAVEKLKTSVHYTFGQVQRLKRVGAREFLRLNEVPGGDKVEIMGDCGSFSFVKAHVPPFTVDSLVEFYTDCQFQYGISLDHVILGFLKKPEEMEVPEDWQRRFDLTLALAEEFFEKCTDRKVPFTPLGAAQGWSPKSYSDAVIAMQKIGYRYIALGGLVPLNNREVMSVLEAVEKVRKSETKLHLLGISRIDHVQDFKKYGVASFDSTSALKKAFMDDKDNYFIGDKAYTAVRIPQVGENPGLKKKILAGEIKQETASELEKLCLQGIHEFDRGQLSLAEIVNRVRIYERLWHGKKDDSALYAETLEAKPWLTCRCEICKTVGIQVVVFRGAERNRRRGFHNLHNLKTKLAEKNKL